MSDIVSMEDKNSCCERNEQANEGIKQEKQPCHSLTVVQEQKTQVKTEACSNDQRIKLPDCRLAATVIENPFLMTIFGSAVIKVEPSEDNSQDLDSCLQVHFHDNSAAGLGTQGRITGGIKRKLSEVRDGPASNKNTPQTIQT
ncbi:unnamed protein product, partial [Candidula unifasciata]